MLVSLCDVIIRRLVTPIQKWTLQMERKIDKCKIRTSLDIQSRRSHCSPQHSRVTVRWIKGEFNCIDSDNHAQAAGAENNGGHLAADWWAVSLKWPFTSWHSLPGHKWSPPNSLPAPRVPIGSNVSCRNTEGNKNKSEFNNSMANDSHA